MNLLYMCCAARMMLRFFQSRPSQRVLVGKLDPRDLPSYIPSPQYLITNFLRASEEQAAYMQLWLATIGAFIIKLDHTFKAASRVRGRSGEQQWGAIFTIMNEYCQVLGQFACAGKSLTEVQAEVEELMKRLTALEQQVCSTFHI